MKSYFLVISLLIGILLGAAGCYIYLELNDHPHFTPEEEKAYKYLVDSYNPKLGLCFEYPGSNRYWVTHDNVLASHALQNWSRSIADNITATVKRIAKEYNLTTNSEGIPGYTVSFLSESSITLLNSSYFGSELWCEKATGIPAVFYGYADLLCFASLNEWGKKNYSGANSYFDQAMTMWNGNGFKDSAYNDTLKSYATYKLGLFYLLSRTLDRHFYFENELIERVWSCQVSNGGFKTEYYGNGTFPPCQTNTETASIILLADVPSLFKYDC
jgi:hypothetical protein